MRTQKTQTGFLFILLFLLSQLAISCTFAGSFGVKGSGVKKTEAREVSNFTGLDISGGFEVVLKQGSTQSVVIEADDNLLRDIITEVRGGELNIYTRNNVWPHTKMKAYITFVKLEDIDISGAVKVFADENLSFDRLGIEGSGASEINFSADVRNLKADFSGASKLILKGNVNTVFIECSGASKLYLADFNANEVQLDLSGASYAEVSAAEKLIVEASGASDVKYKGEPKTFTVDTSGASKVRKL